MTQQTQNWTVNRLLTWTTNFLKQRGSESARLDAEVLLAQARGSSRVNLYTEFDHEVSEHVRKRFRTLVRRRAEGEPVAYLVGHKEFFSLDLAVSPSVLIPRPETEFVVIEFLQLAKGREQCEVVDVGTGSGNIAVAIAKHHPSVRVTALDVRPEALEVARRNAEAHEVTERIVFVEGNLLDALSADARADFILSNPPYVASEEWEQLPAGVRDYEPRVALDGGPGGLAVVERLIRQGADRLRPGGHLILEIGAPQEQSVRQLIEERHAFELAPTVHDYSGHPRVVRAKRLAH